MGPFPLAYVSEKQEANITLPLPSFRRQLFFPWQIATRPDKKDRRKIVDLCSNPGSIAGQTFVVSRLLDE